MACSPQGTLCFFHIDPTRSDDPRMHVPCRGHTGVLCMTPIRTDDSRRHVPRRGLANALYIRGHIIFSVSLQFERMNDRRRHAPCRAPSFFPCIVSTRTNDPRCNGSRKGHATFVSLQFEWMIPESILPARAALRFFVSLQLERVISEKARSPQGARCILYKGPRCSSLHHSNSDA